MVSIRKQIIEDIKNANIIENVHDFYSDEEIKLDLLTIQELPTNDGVEVDGQPKIVKNIYEFEIYAKNRIINNEVYSARDMLDTYSIALDNFINTTYGMTQIGEPVIAPYDTDNTVKRMVLRYSGLIDKDTLKMFRR